MNPNYISLTALAGGSKRTFTYLAVSLTKPEISIGRSVNFEAIDKVLAPHPSAFNYKGGRLENIDIQMVLFVGMSAYDFVFRSGGKSAIHGGINSGMELSLICEKIFFSAAPSYTTGRYKPPPLYQFSISAAGYSIYRTRGYIQSVRISYRLPHDVNGYFMIADIALSFLPHLGGYEQSATNQELAEICN